MLAIVANKTYNISNESGNGSIHFQRGIKMTTLSNSTNKAKLNSKLQVTLNQWIDILNNEMAYSEDLRKTEIIDGAELMIAKIEGMMA